MDVESITADIVGQTLRAWRYHQPPPQALVALDTLPLRAGESATQRELHLRDYLESLVQSELAAARAAEKEGPSPDSMTRTSLLAMLRHDFAQPNPMLRSWSALYHRFLAPVPFETEDLASSIPMTARQFNRYIDGGLHQLAESLQRAELAAHDRMHLIDRRRHLPPPDYAQLFGLDGLQTELGALLRQPDGPRFVSIEGLGGIGKTALARAVAFDLAEESNLDGIAWVSARQFWLSDQGTIEAAPDAVATMRDVINRLADQLGLPVAGLSTADKLTRLAVFLRNVRYLIVIDNLESVGDVDSLLPALTPLAGQTQFLFTSRQAMSSYPFVHRQSVPQLSLTDSRRLVESELNRRGRSEPVNAAAMQQLYDLVGGLPLALKLVAAQMLRWPLETLLDDMRQVRRRAPESLYSYIYRRTWLALDQPAKELLLSLIHISPDGETLSWLELMSDLPPDEIDAALEQLQAYSLLEVSGPSDEPLFRMHRLTLSFLQTDLLADWSGDS